MTLRLRATIVVRRYARVTEIADCVGETSLGDFELDAMVANPVRKLLTRRFV